MHIMKKIKCLVTKCCTLTIDDVPRGQGREVAFSLRDMLSIQMPGLSDRREGEKCRPFDNVLQIPFLLTKQRSVRSVHLFH